jgi:transcriptional regulator with XRE-family HTH domain
MLGSVDEVLAANIRGTRRRRFWDQRLKVDAAEWQPDAVADDLEQAHVAARMRDLGHRWVKQTVSEVERGNRRVTAAELLSLTVVLGATIADLLDPHDNKLALDPAGRVQVDSADLVALVCGHGRRAVAIWSGEEKATLAKVEFREVKR